MEDIKWICTVILSDGTTIVNTQKDGYDFVYEGILSKDIFENNCDTITLESTITFDHTSQHIVETITNLDLDYFEQIYDVCRFRFRELSKAEIKMKKLQADIDFLLMMSGLEEE